jgi:acyl-homoserine-lactone acylase
MVAWADGLNCYLASHPQVQPRVLTRFEPWMALSFTEGSISGDIERIALGPLAALYGTTGSIAMTTPDATLAALDPPPDPEPRGSNGIAIAPAHTANHHALLLINPHTSFYFRGELQVTSDEGLNAYGAATWGQFFIYQGFNERVGWMHTSSGVNSTGFFAEKTVRKGQRLYYRYGQTLRPVTTQTVTVRYRTADGTLAQRRFTVHRTHHGPIVRRDGDDLVSAALMYRPVEALSQSFLRTKAHDYRSYARVLALEAISTNNTIYADADGTIAYLHPQFVPRRSDRWDYTHAVDGSDPATDWRGLHRPDEVPHVINPVNGWVMNTNNWPYSAAGPESPRRADYPRYMDTFGENPRGIHATRLLGERTDFTIESLRAAAFDSDLPEFTVLLPQLLADYERLPATDDRRPPLAPLIDVLQAWDHRWALDSAATTLAMLWGDSLWDRAKQRGEQRGVSTYEALEQNLSADERLDTLVAIGQRLQQDFGRTLVPWGEMNRFQRLTDDPVQPFSDEAPSIPVAFASARWGSLASFGARRQPGTRRYYGTSGNSFVAIVEFGPKVSAIAITAGGESGDPASPHFTDQALRYTQGALRTVYFYPEQLVGHTEAQYAPRCPD